MNPRFDSLENNFDETLHWLWNKDQGPDAPTTPGFVEWLENDKSSIYWVSGKPGAGKSTLMKYAIESKEATLSLRSSSRDWIIVKYFFFELGTPGKPQEKTFSGFLHGILRQLVGEDLELTRLAVQCFSTLPYDKTAALSENVLQKAILLISQQAPSKFNFCVFIDGLDECEGAHIKQLDFLENWLETAKEFRTIKICLASRSEYPFYNKFSRNVGCVIHEFTAKDISMYVTTMLEKAMTAEWPQSMPGIAVDKSLISSVVDKAGVVDKADGVWIWVYLVVSILIDEIGKSNDIASLAAVLDSLPPTLETLYNNIVKRLELSDLPDMINFLLLLNIANYMSIEEFSLATGSVALEPWNSSTNPWLVTLCTRTKLRIQSVCRGLVQVSKPSNGVQSINKFPSHPEKVHILHRTVKEFLFTQGQLELLTKRVDHSKLCNPNTSLMILQLRLLELNKDTWPQHAHSPGNSCNCWLKFVDFRVVWNRNLKVWRMLRQFVVLAHAPGGNIDQSTKTGMFEWLLRICHGVVFQELLSFFWDHKIIPERHPVFRSYLGMSADQGAQVARHCNKDYDIPSDAADYGIIRETGVYEYPYKDANFDPKQRGGRIGPKGPNGARGPRGAKRQRTELGESRGGGSGENRDGATSVSPSNLQSPNHDELASNRGYLEPFLHLTRSRELFFSFMELMLEKVRSENLSSDRQSRASHSHSSYTSLAVSNGETQNRNNHGVGGSTIPNNEDHSCGNASDNALSLATAADQNECIQAAHQKEKISSNRTPKF